MEVHGTGKSFFTKLMILRNYINNINGYIFDIEGEYVDIVNKCNGTILSVDNYFNILEISKYDLCENFLVNKCNEVIRYIIELSENDEDKEYIKLNKDKLYNVIYNVYNSFNIIDDIESIYSSNKNYINKKIKSKEEFPTLNDVTEYIKMRLKSIRIKTEKEVYIRLNKIIEQIILQYKMFSKYTNINIYDNIVCLNLKNIEKDKVINISKVLLELINKKISSKENKILIYIDEFWKYVFYDKELASRILEMFKTIRKNNAGIVVITQDICDVFSNNDLGKSIINNSCFCILFKMEYSQKEELNRSSMGFNDMTSMVQALNKGNCILKINSNIVKMEVVASESEIKLLKGEF